MPDTGIYFRAKKDGKWDSILIEDLNGNEIMDVLKDKTPSFLVSLIIKLADHIYKYKT